MAVATCLPEVERVAEVDKQTERLVGVQVCPF